MCSWAAENIVSRLGRVLMVASFNSAEISAASRLGIASLLDAPGCINSAWMVPRAVVISSISRW